MMNRICFRHLLCLISAVSLVAFGPGDGSARAQEFDRGSARNGADQTKQPGQQCARSAVSLPHDGGSLADATPDLVAPKP